MDNSQKFDPTTLNKFNNPERFEWINSDSIWTTLELKNTKTLIDIGAGTGICAREFAKKINNGKIYACDSSKIMVDWMQENLPEKNIIPFLTKENSIDLDNGIADLVYMITVHHELLEPEKLLKEGYRLLKSGGKITIMDWKKEEMIDGPSIEKRISEEMIIKQLKNVGFNNISQYNLLPLHSFIITQTLFYPAICPCVDLTFILNMLIC